MTTADEIQAVVDAYVDSYRRNDKQACLDLFAPDGVWHDPVGEPPHVGPEGVGTFWDQTHLMAEAIELVPNNVIVCADQAVMVFEIHVTLAGADGGPSSTMIMDAVELFTIDAAGKISELRAYWDMTRARTRG